MAYIDIIDSNGTNLRYPLPEDDSVLLIGSAEDCSVSLPHLQDMLPQHCTVTLQPEGYVLAPAVEGAPLSAAEAPVEGSVLLQPQVAYGIGSTMLLFGEGDPAEAPAEEYIEVEEEAPGADATGAPRPRKKKVRRPLPRPTIVRTEEDSTLHIILRRLYVIAMLALAFLAGLTLRYWIKTGGFLPSELLK